VKRIGIIISKGFLSLTIVMLSSLVPMATSAADSTCTPPPSSAGVHWPTGSAAGTYTYQCDGAYAGKWINTYYVYNPSTGAKTPLYTPKYTYDCSTSTWYVSEWDYSPADGQWHENQVVTNAPGGIATGCPVANTPAATSGTGGGGTDSSTNGTGGTGTIGGSTVSNTGPGSTNTSNSTGNNTLNSTNSTGITVTNNIASVAASGNGLVLGNTTAGNATTGLTQDEANIVNLLQSSTNALGSGSNVVTFTANINGDVNGDLLFDPASVGAIQNAGPNSTNTVGSTTNNNLTVNNSTGAAINNNINLASNSGNATVADNTTGGNATSGAAETIANVVNVIDSAITAGKSFVGTINVNGNLNGDILLPPNFINQLLAANVPTVTLTGPNSTNSSNTTTNNNTSVTNSNNLGINNNVNATAASGTAAVTDNTSAGNATSGSANTKITAFNLTGSNVIGANDLLVFVNVTGTWVGLIVNAPPGTTAAELGGGITSTGPNSTNTTNSTTNNNATLNNNTNEQINNNITTAAKSGNATVSDNTQGGDAKSGNADNAVNVLNMENSTLDLTGWFGILFINVFGTWNGSFGINTAAGDPVASPGAVYSPVLAFVPHATTSGSGHSSNYSYSYAPYAGSGSSSSTTTLSPANAILAASHRLHAPYIPSASSNTASSGGHINWALALSGGGAFILYLLIDSFRSARRTH
jgi:hypothetical protein